MPRFWMVRASGGDNIEAFKKANAVGIGFGLKVSLAGARDREGLRLLLQQSDRDANPRALGAALGCLNKIRFAVEPGDTVITYDPSKREYSVGEITSEYLYGPNIFANLPHVRRVTWKGTINRDDLSPAACNSLGSLLTIFEPGNEVLAEVEALLSGTKSPHTTPVALDNDETEAKDEDAIRQETVSKAHEFIKDRISKLDWDEMQELVAAILRAMGYKTRVSPQGSDRGKDIVASPDGLGLQHPRIKVEVKHRLKQGMGAPEIRSFLGGLRGDDRGLYVSTGGFSNEAMYEAERAPVPVTLLNLDDLARLLVEHHDRMDLEGRALVPLKRVFWPAT